MSHHRTIYILCHEQAVYGRVTKWVKVYLTNVGNKVMWLSHFSAESESQRQCLCRSKNRGKMRLRRGF